MAPCLSFYDLVHACPRHAVVPRKRLHGSAIIIFIPNVGYLLSCYLRRVMSFPSGLWANAQTIYRGLSLLGIFTQKMVATSNKTFWIQPRPVSTPCGHSSFTGRVLRVLSMVTQEQVTRVTARWIVAMMAYQRLGRLSACRKKDCDTVSAHHTSANLKQSVAVMRSRGSPFPADVTTPDLNERPKPFNVLLGEQWQRRIRFSHDLILLKAVDQVVVWLVRVQPYEPFYCNIMKGFRFTAYDGSVGGNYRYKYQP